MPACAWAGPATYGISSRLSHRDRTVPSFPGRLSGADFIAEAQDAQRALAATLALCGAACHAAADAEECVAGIVPGFPGLFTTSELWEECLASARLAALCRRGRRFRGGAADLRSVCLHL